MSKGKACAWPAKRVAACQAAGMQAAPGRLKSARSGKAALIPHQPHRRERKDAAQALFWRWRGRNRPQLQRLEGYVGC
jgi:hypothetical protein